MVRVAIITGGSSGIGLETARALAAKGCRVYEFSRREAPQDPCHRRVDVTDEAAARAAVDEIAAREGCTAIIGIDAHDPDIIANLPLRQRALDILNGLGMKILDRLPGVEAK